MAFYHNGSKGLAGRVTSWLPDYWQIAEMNKETEANDAGIPGLTDVGSTAGVSAPSPPVQKGIGAVVGTVLTVPYSIVRRAFGQEPWHPVPKNKKPQYVAYDSVPMDAKLWKRSKNVQKSIVNQVRFINSRKIPIPSAITLKDGINKNQMSKSNKNKKKTKKNKPNRSTKPSMTRKPTVRAKQALPANYRTNMHGAMVPIVMAPRTPFLRAKKRKPYKGKSVPGDKIMSAPTALGVSRSGNIVTFSAGRTPGSLVMRGRFLLGSIWITTDAETKVQTSWMNGGITSATHMEGQYYFNPTNTYYFGGPFSVFSQYFDRYKVAKVGWEWTSSTPTNTDYQITWCMCHSVDHWERLGISSASVPPTREQIMGMSTARTFPAWQPKAYLSLGSGLSLYTATAEATTNPYAFGSPIAEARQSWGFTCGFIASGTVPSYDVPYKLGDVTIDITLELWDMTYGGGNPITALRRENKLRSEEKRMDDLLAAAIARKEAKEKAEFDRLEAKELKTAFRVIDEVTRKKKDVPGSTSDDDDFVGIQHPRKKKSSSVKSDIVHHTKKYDSTLGYPGEGPFTVVREDFYSWCFRALTADYRTHQVRLAALNGFKQILDRGGDFKIATSDVVTIIQALDVSPFATDISLRSVYSTLVSAHHLASSREIAYLVSKSEKEPGAQIEGAEKH